MCVTEPARGVAARAVSGRKDAVGHHRSSRRPIPWWLVLLGVAALGIRVPFTQQQVGDACGLSVVHVNRTLQELI